MEICALGRVVGGCKGVGSQKANPKRNLDVVAASGVFERFPLCGDGSLRIGRWYRGELCDGGAERRTASGDGAGGTGGWGGGLRSVGGGNYVGVYVQIRKLFIREASVLKLKRDADSSFRFENC